VQSQECPCTDDLDWVDSKIKAMVAGWVEVVEIVGLMYQHGVHAGQHLCTDAVQALHLIDF
jgi:hypothetical protein